MTRIIFHIVNYSYPNVAPSFLQFIEYLRYRGFEVEFAFTKEELFELVKKKKYDSVGISSYTCYTRSTLELARDIKKIDPSVVVCLGGRIADKACDKLIKNPCIDVVVEGEAEMVFPEILSIIKRSKNNISVPVGKLVKMKDRDEAKKIFGKYIYKSPITEKQKEKILKATFTRDVVINGSKKTIKVPISNIAFETNSGETYYIKDTKLWSDEEIMKWYNENKKIPFEKYKLNMHSYPTEEEINEHCSMPIDIIRQYGWPAISVSSQRGCAWGRCIFCNTSRNVRKIYNKNIKNILTLLSKENIICIDFNDDQFIRDDESMKDILSFIESKRLNYMYFQALIRIDGLNEELIERFKRCNFSIACGLETMLPEKAEYLRKTFNGENYIRLANKYINYCGKVGLPVSLYLILSTPQSTIEEISEDILKISDFVHGFYKNYDSTPFVLINIMVLPDVSGEIAKIEKVTMKKIPISIQNNEIRYIDIMNKIQFRDKHVGKMMKNMKNPDSDDESNLMYILRLAKKVKKFAENNKIKNKKTVIKNCNNAINNFNMIPKDDLMK